MNVNRRSRLKTLSYFGLVVECTASQTYKCQKHKDHVLDCGKGHGYGQDCYRDGAFEVRVIHREYHEFYTYACVTIKSVLHAEYFSAVSKCSHCLFLVVHEFVTRSMRPTGSQQ